MDPNAWLSNASYIEGDRVRLDTTRLIYECLIPITGGLSPDIDVLALIPKWITVQYINYYAMFDYTRNTKTVTYLAGDAITAVLTPGEGINSLFLIGLENVYKVSITMVYGITTVYSYTLDQIFSGIPIIQISKFDVSVVPCVITVVMEGNGIDLLGCKYLAIGTTSGLGDVQYSVKLDNNNFSSVSRDEFGIATLIQRRSVLKVNYLIFVKANLVDSVLLSRNNLNAIPAVWYAMENNEIPEYNDNLLMLGVYKTFSLTLDSPIGATLTLELEEI